jgi:hypothetical protein
LDIEWNIKIEAIDMLHFMTSIALFKGVPQEECQLTFCDLDSLPSEEAIDYVFNIDVTKGNRHTLANIGQLIFADEVSFFAIDYMLRASGLTATEVSAVYIAKYTLNEFRYENGYDLGVYNKFIELTDDSGKRVIEDNAFLEVIVTEFINDPDMLLEQIPAIVRNTMEDLLSKNGVDVPGLDNIG